MPLAPTLKTDGSGMPHWFLYAAGGASILGLIVFLSKQNSSAPSTTAAGTSINAALGSIQEEILNAQGVASKEHQGIVDTINGNSAAILAGENALGTSIGNVSTQIGNQGAQLSGQITSSQQAVQQQNQTYATALGLGLAGLSTQQAQEEQAILAGQSAQTAVVYKNDTAILSPLGVSDPRVAEWDAQVAAASNASAMYQNAAGSTADQSINHLLTTVQGTY